MSDIDKRARKILFDTYWSAAGWKDFNHPQTPAADFEYAKAAGLMFDPIPVRHDDIQRRVRQACQTIGKRRAANAFLASLSTRRLDWRSALGSYAVFHRMPEHEPLVFANHPWADCDYCRLNERDAEDINALSFSRLKWGGVEHDMPLYAMLDLEWLLREPEIVPVEEDIRILRALLSAISAVPEKTTATRLAPYLSPLLATNRDESNILVEILGFCGILETREHPGYRTAFVPLHERADPPRRGDMDYPANWWRGSDGLNTEAVEYYFGHALVENQGDCRWNAR